MLEKWHTAMSLICMNEKATDYITDTLVKAPSRISSASFNCCLVMMRGGDINRVMI